MRFIFRSVAGLIATAAITLCTATVAAPAAQATVHGCPSYSVCMYPRDSSWNGDVPSRIIPASFPWGSDHLWRNLTAQYGKHKILNNAYCVRVTLNKGYNGGGEHVYPLEYGHSADRYFDEINSITLWVLDTGECAG
jgi:hypothetical protein